MPPRQLSRDDYTVGIICALDFEKEIAETTLDEEHGKLQNTLNDNNVYAFGRIGEHNVVIGCLPTGVMGKMSAATVAMSMMRSFPIKVGLMVGIGGGVWTKSRDIRLGDVVVGMPDEMQGGVVQWDCAKTESFGSFWRTGILNKPPQQLFDAVQSLRRMDSITGGVGGKLGEIFNRDLQLRTKFGYPGTKHDVLFLASYEHVSGETCANCDRSRLVHRTQMSPTRGRSLAQIHYGDIASSSEALEHGPTRDSMTGFICFETEAAGLPDTFPYVVIRGVCGYVDSHKNVRWQRYAAAAAAAYAKEVLLSMRSPDVKTFAASSALDDRKQKTQARHRRNPASYAYPVAETSTVHHTLDGIDSPQISAAPAGHSPVLQSARKLAIFQRIKPCYLMVALGLLAIGGSLAVGLFYSIAQDRMGDGFTTAGWIVAVSTLMLAAPMAKHYPNCRCWDSHEYAVL
jgi:nucleoside phosphorylase